MKINWIYEDLAIYVYTASATSLISYSAKQARAIPTITILDMTTVVTITISDITISDVATVVTRA